MGNQKNKMKVFSLLSVICALSLITETEAKKMQTGIIGFVNEYFEVMELVKNLEKKNRDRKGHPRVKSIAYDIVMNFVTLMQEPSWEAFRTVLVDYASYIVMPLEGGYSAANAHFKFLQDERTYKDAGVTEDFLFIETTNLFKEKFWQFFGMFDRLAATTGIVNEE